MTIDIDELRQRFRANLMESFTDQERTAIAHHAYDASVFQPCKDVVTQVTRELLFS